MSSFVIFDLEYTWRDDDPSFDRNEIIQVAALRVEAGTLEVLDTLALYVKPTLDPIIPQCEIDYTGITQEQVDTLGVTFPVAYAAFKKFSETLPCFSHGWSRDTSAVGDGEKFMKGLVYNGMRDDSPPDYRNIAPWFKQRYREAGLDIVKQNSSQIAGLLGREENLKTLGLQPHNGLYDAHSILEGIRYFGGKWLL